MKSVPFISILILCSHLRLCLAGGLFPSYLSHALMASTACRCHGCDYAFEQSRIKLTSHTILTHINTPRNLAVKMLNAQMQTFTAHKLEPNVHNF
jgi:hypothetical protein